MAENEDSTCIHKQWCHLSLYSWFSIFSCFDEPQASTQSQQFAAEMLAPPTYSYWLKAALAYVGVFCFFFFFLTIVHDQIVHIWPWHNCIYSGLRPMAV